MRPAPVQLRKANGVIHVPSGDGRRCRLESERERISKMNGVSKVVANHVSHTLTIEYDPKRVTMEAIRGTIPDY